MFDLFKDNEQSFGKERKKEEMKVYVPSEVLEEGLDPIHVYGQLGVSKQHVVKENVEERKLIDPFTGEVLLVVNGTQEQKQEQEEKKKIEVDNTQHVLVDPFGDGYLLDRRAEEERKQREAEADFKIEQLRLEFEKMWGKA